MTKRLCTLFFTIITAACSTAVTPTYTSSGESGYRLVCGGIFGDGDMGGCYQKAGEICERKGFSVKQTGVGSMIVSCKESSSSENRSSWD
jgi:hypothetical protein